LRRLLEAHRGDIGVIVRIDGNGARTLRLSVGVSVSAVDPLTRFLAVVGGTVRLEGRE
jgi:hypothetical protein